MDVIQIVTVRHWNMQMWQINVGRTSWFSVPFLDWVSFLTGDEEEMTVKIVTFKNDQI